MLNDFKNVKEIPLNTILLGKVVDKKEIFDLYLLTISKNLKQYQVYVLNTRPILVGNEVEILNPVVLQKSKTIGETQLTKGDIFGELAEPHDFSDVENLKRLGKSYNFEIKGLAVGYHKAFSEVVEYGKSELFHPNYETEDKYIGIYGQPSGMSKINVEFFKKDCIPINYSRAYDILKSKGYEHIEIVRWLGTD